MPKSFLQASPVLFDEFELFGMTKSDISQQFKDKLTFDPDC
jgi:hypothetical protein